MKQVGKLGLILFLITSVSAGLLSVVNDATKEIIQENAMKANFAYMQDMLPDANEFTVIEDPSIVDIESVDEVYEGLQDGSIIGYAIKTKTSGYGGAIEIIFAINIDGTIAGMRVASHAETPGLGARITEEDFTSEFEGQSIDSELELNTDIDTISGATISAQAAVDGANAAIKVFNEVLN